MGDPASHDETASRVFAALARSAIVHDGMAVWIGRRPAAGGASWGTIGPSVYDGTAGLALGFAKYGHESGESWALDMARMAITHALDHVEDVPGVSRNGYYSGRAGILHAALMLSRSGACDDPKLVTKARDILAAIAANPVFPGYDVVSGASGSVAGLALSVDAVGEQAIALAMEAATALRGSARGVRGWRDVRAWKPLGLSGRLPLTGFSHGCSGVAWALLELWSTHPLDWLRELADAALRYEDRLFDGMDANWPDLRHYATWRSVRLLAPPCQAVWCHGAGGIALARLRAHELTGEPAHLVSARAAISILSRQSRPMTDIDEASLSLCHGLAGNAQILSIAATRLADPSLHILTATLQARLAAGIREILSRPRATGDEPGLMLGLAGGAMSLLTGSGPWHSAPLLPSPLWP